MPMCLVYTHWSAVATIKVYKNRSAVWAENMVPTLVMRKLSTFAIPRRWLKTYMSITYLHTHMPYIMFEVCSCLKSIDCFSL